MQNMLCEQIKNTAGVNISIIDFVHSIRYFENVCACEMQITLLTTQQDLMENTHLNTN